MQRGVLLIPVAGLALSACSEQPAAPETVDEFAQRVGTATTSGSAVEGNTQQPAAAEPAKTVQVSASTGTTATLPTLETLGDFSDLNLGPKAGECNFSSGSTQIVSAVGPEDKALPGKAAVRIGGELVVLDAPPGGYDAVKAGTVFRGEGFAVQVFPSATGAAQLAITNGQGGREILDGQWVCA